MWFAKKGKFTLLGLLMVLLSTSVFAAEDIDCRNYEKGNSKFDKCVYARVEVRKNFGLFVLKDTTDRSSKNAKPNADFYVYAPKAGSDSVLITKNPSTEGGSDTTVADGQLVNSGETGILGFHVKGYYPMHNIPMGTSVDGKKVEIAMVYNFYLPKIQYCLDPLCEQIVDKDTKLQLDVGETQEVYVRALIGEGPGEDALDSTLNKSFYFSTEGAAKNLRFYDDMGKELTNTPNGVLLNIEGGKAYFVVAATKAVTDGSTFALNAYPDGTDKNGDPQFLLTEPFPGDLQFVNPDMPTLDSAQIFDSNGDGLGDSIVVYFNGKMDSISVDGFSYYWPEKAKFTKVDSWKANPKNERIYGLPDVKTKLQSESAEGEVRSAISSVNTGKVDTLYADLLDRIGLVIQVATLTPGHGDDKDTLEVRFNKKMDSDWDSGKGFLLNGEPLDVEAIEKNGNVWNFVVKHGVVEIEDSLKINTSCEKGCPDGVMTAADGIPTAKNNQCVPVQNAGRVYVNDNNGFYDRDGDGQMDSASIAFDSPLTPEDLKKMEVIFYWLDSKGNLLTIRPKTSDLVLSEDGLVVGYAVDTEKYDVRKMLTGIDSALYSPKHVNYGYATVINKEEKDGKVTYDTIPFPMNDRMPPVITKTFLDPESFRSVFPDEFSVSFSEKVDASEVASIGDCFEFLVDGEWKTYEVENFYWTEDGLTLKMQLEAGDALSKRMNPADSIRYADFTSGIVDLAGNKVTNLAPVVLVEGDPRVVMQNMFFASRHDADVNAKKSIVIDRRDDLSKDFIKHSLGVLMDISYATILDPDSSDPTKLDLSGTGLEWQLDVFTNLGAYVAGSSGKVKCNDKKIYDGNCFENPHQMYIHWNMLSDEGRLAGVGVYVARLKIKVYGSKDNFVVERLYDWGVTGSRKIHSSK